MQIPSLVFLTMAAFITFISPANSNPLLNIKQDTDTLQKPWLLSSGHTASVASQESPSSGMKSFYQSLYGQLSREQPVVEEPFYKPSSLNYGYNFMDTAYPSFPGPEEEEVEEEPEEVISPHTRNLIARIMQRALVKKRY